MPKMELSPVSSNQVLPGGDADSLWSDLENIHESQKLDTLCKRFCFLNVVIYLQKLKNYSISQKKAAFGPQVANS